MKKLNITREQEKLLLTGEFLNEPQTLLYTTDPSFSNKVYKKEFLLNGEKQIDLSEVSSNQRIYVAGIDNQQVYVGAERRVSINGLYNCRDLGGYVTKEKQMTKWGYLFRSDAPDHLLVEDQRYLKQMDIKTVIDLRSPGEIEKNPDKDMGETDHIELDPHAEVAKKASEVPSQGTSNKDEVKVHMLEQLASTAEGQATLIKWQKQMIQQMHDLVMTEKSQAAYSRFLKMVNQTAEPKALIFHCQGGKDRTGWGAALILGLLGVDKKTIYQDYLLTDTYNRPRNEMRMAIYKQYTDNAFVLDYLASLQQTKVDYLDGAFHVMEKEFGTIEVYAKEKLDVTDSDIQRLKSTYLYNEKDRQNILNRWK